jgi:putative heme iron utilization protein
VAPQILEHVNADHGEALLVLAKVAGGIDAEEASMTSIDRLGFHLRLRAGDRVIGRRIAFPTEVRTTAEARTALMKLLADARAEREGKP